MRPVITIAIPCFNEGQNLPTLIRACVELTYGQRVRVTFVNNGSTDNSKSIFQQHSAVWNSALSWIDLEKNLGYGGGIMAGLADSNSDYVGWTHADMQTHPSDILKAIPLIEDSSETLFIKGAREGRPLGDRILSGLMGFTESLLFRKRLFEINAQPTIFHRSLLDTWGSPPSDFTLDLFSYVRAIEAGFVQKRFGVKFNVRLAGESKWNTSATSRVRAIIKVLLASIAMSRKRRASNKPILG